MSCIAVLITGDPIATVCRYTTSFTPLIRDIAGSLEATWAEIDLRNASKLPDPREFAACIIGGSPHSVTERAPWMLRAEAYLRDARTEGTLLFGICFGHQLLTSAFGGRVTHNPNGREMGLCVTRPVAPCEPLGWSAEPTDVLMSHGDTVSVPPPGARVLATTSRDAHAALDYGDLCFSTQFHPEFTPCVLQCYLEHYRQLMQSQGDDVDQLIAGLRETPKAREVLREFLHLAVQNDEHCIRRCAS
jgi:GMP synthase (glutamine-hydrolysing)